MAYRLAVMRGQTVMADFKRLLADLNADDMSGYLAAKEPAYKVWAERRLGVD